MKKWNAILLLLSVFTTAVPANGIPKGAYVLNTLGQNLSVINLQNGNVTLDALPLGLFANVIKVRGMHAYVVNSGVNEIQVINLNPLSTVGNIDVGNGTNPWGLDFVNDSIAAVSLLFTDQLAIVNVNAGQVIQYVPVGTGPQGVKYYSGKIYVANSGFNGAGYDPGTVSVIDANSFNLIDTFNVGINPWDLDVDSQSHLAVVCAGDYVSINGEMDIINLNTGNGINTIPFGTQLTSVGINSQDQCYIGTYGAGVMVYDLITQSFERDESNPLPGGPGIDFDQQDNVYITGFAQDSVRVFSPSHQKITSYLVGDGPASIAIFDPPQTSVDPQVKEVPEKIWLFQNYPNPFNPSTNIEFRISEHGFVELDIFDLAGKRVRTLVDEIKGPGRYVVNWDGRDNGGRSSASGVYFYRLEVGEFIEIHKMHLIW